MTVRVSKAALSSGAFRREVARLLARLRWLRALESGEAEAQRVRVRGYRVPGYRVRPHWRLVSRRSDRIVARRRTTGRRTSSP